VLAEETDSHLEKIVRNGIERFVEEGSQGSVGGMDAAWIMCLRKGEKVASQNIRGNFLNELQRVCVAILNESTQELPIELERVSR